MKSYIMLKAVVHMVYREKPRRKKFPTLLTKGTSMKAQPIEKPASARK